MTQHDVDAFLDGGASQSGAVDAIYALIATHSGDSSQTGDIGVAMPVDSSLSGNGSVNSDIGLGFSVDASLSGDASVTADAVAAWAVDAAMSGDAAQVADLFLLIGVNASMSGDATYDSAMVAFLSAILTAAGSGFQVGTLADLVTMTFQGGGSFLQANVTWTPHPGSPPGPPAINAGATLQQFIDATGSGKSRNKTTVSNSPAVDSNPVKKPFKPK